MLAGDGYLSQCQGQQETAARHLLLWPPRQPMADIPALFAASRDRQLARLFFFILLHHLVSVYMFTVGRDSVVLVSGGTVEGRSGRPSKY